MDWVKNLSVELKDVLKEELEVYKNILELTTKKTQIITSGQVKDLDKITHVEHSLIMKIGKLEDKRERIVENIEKFLELESPLNMSKITNYLDDEDKKEIEDLKDVLVSVLKEIKEKNNLNSMLIKDSLDYINLNINLLTNVTTQNTYDNKTKKAVSSQSKSIFDTKV